MARIKEPTAHKHQTVSLKHADKTPIRFDASDPGTGKTFVRIVHFARRRRKKGGCLLVVCPRSLLRAAWANDFKKFAPDMKVSVATAANRVEAFAEDADVYITNTDAAVWLGKQKKTFFAKFDELAIDESTAFKNGTSQRARAMLRVSKHFTYRTVMSGTPFTKSITDLWHQTMLLDGGQRLGPLYTQFRSTVCEPTQVGRDVRAVAWADREGAEDAVFGLLSDVLVRHKLEDCVDIPANHTYEVEYELPVKVRKVYDKMEADRVFQSTVAAVTNRMLGTKPVPGNISSAVNAAAVANKLLQIASGAVYTTVGKYELVDPGRYELTLDLVEQAKHSLVFFLWKHQRDMLVDMAGKRGMKFCVIDGATGDKEREQYVAAYQAGFYDVMFAHPQSAGHGLTLTRGTRTIWPSPTYNLEHVLQGNRRIVRIGQTQKTETIYIHSPNTIEDWVYEVLNNKNQRAASLMALFATAGQ